MAERSKHISKDWYERAFDSLYPIVYAHRTVEAAREEAEFSIEQTRLTESDRVLDLCCGNGRHMAHLVEISSCVVGLDYSSHLLGIAKHQLGSRAHFVRGDMRSLPFQAEFDVVMNFFTSMGYFVSESENQMVVCAIADALKPGGRFFIDYMNPDWTRANLQPETLRSEGAYEIRERRWIENERINKTTSVVVDGETVGESGESVKLYSESEFTDLLNTCGLAVETYFGDYTGVETGTVHPRMIAVGRKI